MNDTNTRLVYYVLRGSPVSETSRLYLVQSRTVRIALGLTELN